MHSLIKTAIDTARRAQRNEVKLLVGIGFENFNIDRRLHTETLNKEVPKEYQTGPLEEKWRFPSFEKCIKFTINNNEDTS